MENHAHSAMDHASRGHYTRLLVMVVLSFIAMYVLMYAMVNVLANVYLSFNQVYMAALMTAAMVMIELVLMRSMYHDTKRNAIILLGAFVLLIGSWVFIRRQVAIGDSQFLRSMIPHHAGAILMCEQASLRDADIRGLCEGIITSQQAEIEEMKLKLRGAPSRVAQDSSAVATTVKRFQGALADADSSTALSLLADDAIVLESGDIETRQQYRAQHLPADIEFARAVPSTRQLVLIVVRSNLAWVVSSSRARGTFRAKSIDSQGAELMVLARERAGWRIRAIHWSSHTLSSAR